jgi:MFS family permease
MRHTSISSETIYTGQAFLLIGNITGSVRLMVFGMFVFGLGVSPLAVTQEAIIVRFFRSQGLGVSMAFGLVAGKGASFVSARISYPLSERFGPHAPFYVATGLAAFSLIMNVVYISVSRWLVRQTGAELEASELQVEARKRAGHDLSEAQALEEVARKHQVVLSDITKLGDIFWAYVKIAIFYPHKLNVPTDTSA